ncbi:MAG: ECF transporter S component [Halanaerobiales bacterium]
MAEKNIKEVFLDFNLKEAGARIISYLALFIAFTTVATFIHIPGPSSSYFNLGELAIYSIALVFGGKAGGIAGGVGSAMADLILGYSIWAPFTFIVKGLEGYVVGKISEEGNLIRNILAIIVGGHIMIIGYAITKGFLISWAVILAEIGIDYGQMIIGGIAALIIANKLNEFLK